MQIQNIVTTDWGGKSKFAVVRSVAGRLLFFALEKNDLFGALFGDMASVLGNILDVAGFQVHASQAKEANLLCPACIARGFFLGVILESFAYEVERFLYG